MEREQQCEEYYEKGEESHFCGSKGNVQWESRFGRKPSIPSSYQLAKTLDEKLDSFLVSRKWSHWFSLKSTV